MSIASLADVRIQRTEAEHPTEDAPTTKAGIPAGVLNTLAAWVPTETLAGYVAIQQAQGELKVGAGQKLCEQDFGGRWQLFGLMLLLSLALVPIYTKIKTNRSTTEFKWPVLEMFISATAFTLWTLALQDSPFNDWCSLEAWHSVAALVVGGGLLGALTLMLKTSPAWSEAADNNAPPAPAVN